jgi:hypothetical protein
VITEPMVVDPDRRHPCGSLRQHTPHPWPGQSAVTLGQAPVEFDCPGHPPVPRHPQHRTRTFPAARR